MAKEYPKQSSTSGQNSIKKIESQRFVSQYQEDVADNELMTYEWVEDHVINKTATVEFTTNSTGKEAANIRMLNKKTGEKEVIYHTEAEAEIGRLKAVTEGKTIIVEVPEEDKKDSNKAGLAQKNNKKFRYNKISIWKRTIKN